MPELNKEILHDALSSLSIDSDCSRASARLGIGYDGARGVDTWQRVPFVAGLEHLAVSPVNIPSLAAYFATPPQLPDSRDDPVQRKLLTVTKSDPFTCLSPEVLIMVESHMDILTSVRWRRASAVAANICVSNRSWKKRLFLDMPWLRDVVEPGTYERLESIDWERVFKDLWRASMPSGEAQFHGLSNRRRIWNEQCPMIAREYELMMIFKNTSLRDLNPQLTGVSVQRSSCLVVPEPLKTSIYTPTLLDNKAEMTTIEPSLSVEWTSLGSVATIDVLKNDWMESFGHNFKEDDFDCEPKAHVEAVLIPQGDWVTGFTFFLARHRSQGQEEIPEAPGLCWEVPEEQDDDDVEMQYFDEPDTSSMFGDDEEDTEFLEEFEREGALQFEEYGEVRDEEEPGMVSGKPILALNQQELHGDDRRVVGFEVHLAWGDRIRRGYETRESRMIHVADGQFVVGLSTTRSTSRGILSQVDLIQAPATPDNCADISRVMDMRWADHEFDPCQLTWRPEPPPADMRLCSPVLTGDQSGELLWGEMLVLGQCEEELASMMAIRACVSPLCLQVDYCDRPSRRVGAALPANAWTFPIDGHGGERIVLVFVAPPWAGGWGIRIVTNRDRQMSLGGPVGNPETRFPPEMPPGKPLPALGGIYLTWRSGCHSFDPPHLSGIGYMTRNGHFVDGSADAEMAEGDSAFGCDEINGVPGWALELSLIGSGWTHEQTNSVI